MKKSLVMLVVLAVLAMATAAFAQDTKENAVAAEFIKTYEKMFNNCSFTIETKKDVDGKEVTETAKMAFKDDKTFKIEGEANGTKMLIVVTAADKFIYIPDQKILTPVPAEQAAAMDLRAQIEKEMKESEVTEGKEGENKAYILFNKTKKEKSINVLDAKLGICTKAIKLDEKGKKLEEVTVKDVKFEKIDDSAFKRPADAKEFDPTKMQAPPTEEPKKDEPKKDETKKEEPQGK